MTCSCIPYVKIDDNCPEHGTQHPHHLSRRDEMAKTAMLGILSGTTRDSKWTWRDMCVNAIALADALIAELDANPDSSSKL